MHRIVRGLHCCNGPLSRFCHPLLQPSVRFHLEVSGWWKHYVTVKSWNIILVSHNIPRAEICWILPSVRRDRADSPLSRFCHPLLQPSVRFHLEVSGWWKHYVTVKSWNIILVSHNIPRAEICWILPSVRRELRSMIEGDKEASRPLLLTP